MIASRAGIRSEATSSQSDRPYILIVDDQERNLVALEAVLHDTPAHIIRATSGDQALALSLRFHFSLAILDVQMPGMDGYEVAEFLTAQPTEDPLPIIFVTAAYGDEMHKLQGYTSGAVDYLAKPINPAILLAKVNVFLELARTRAALSQQNKRLQEMVAAKVREISEAQMATILALARLTQSRDDATGMHVERIGKMSTCLTSAALQHSTISVKELEQLEPIIGIAAILHDIGKVAIPDAILQKPGKLASEEFELMKDHTSVGADTLSAVLSGYPGNSFLATGVNIARSHHEQWAGGGYPDGLIGAAIPVSARICAVVDIYDAVRSERPYKPLLSHSEAVEIVNGLFGHHLDPDLSQAFLSVEERLDEIWTEMTLWHCTVS
jgi:putative two-component system response regulator